MSALREGFHSVMVDGSALPVDANSALTQRVAAAAHAAGVLVEAELGRIAGEEDGVTVADLEARMTSPTQVRDRSRGGSILTLHSISWAASVHTKHSLAHRLATVHSSLCVVCCAGAGGRFPACHRSGCIGRVRGEPAWALPSAAAAAHGRHPGHASPQRPTSSGLQAWCRSGAARSLRPSHRRRQSEFTLPANGCGPPLVQAL